ncbi:MAG: RHS repeat-associated core domain-containing protein, partial [Cyclobacteriaceae bacterium]|nr:RHS repeat-associated core domain-containing protein [Cyclobacteriaceae bacterium]
MNYNFVGDLTHDKYIHTATGHTSLTIDKTYAYDHMSRLMSISYLVNGANEATLVTNDYNELGEMVTKYLHGNVGSNFQKVDYRYNIRGWLTQINDPNNVSLSGDYFGMKLKYNDPQFTASLNSEAQYNGNISEIQWQNAQTTTLSGYGFKYDDLNRLKTSHFGSGTAFTGSNAHWDENLSYDFNGNIMSLTRNAAGTNVDNLDYNYTGTGNKLNYVKDNNTTYTGEENHFKDGNPGIATDYAYDANGNMIEDKNKGITAIAYNHLNLPSLITFGNGNTIEYIYDASGVKLQKIVKESGQADKTTDYVGGMVYEDNARKFIATEEGRIMLENTPEYQYHMKDHLGNVRLTFTTASSAQQTSTYMATM